MMEDVDIDSDTESDVRAHYIELVKSFYIDGFADEFEISGQQIRMSDYGIGNDLGNAEGDGMVSAYRSLDLFWRASVLCLCGCFAYCMFYTPKKKSNREQRARKLDSRKRDAAPSPHSFKGGRKEDSKKGSKKKIVDRCRSGNLIAPELVLEKSDPLMPPDISVHGSLVNIPFREDVQLAITVDSLGHELVKTAQSFKKIIESSGIGGSEEMVSNLSWQAAMTLKQTAAICHATSIAETRGYIFQTQQSRLDREISARQHKELLTSIREDKLWPQKLVEARRECFATLRVASLRSFALILSFNPFLIATGLLFKWKFHPIGDLLSDVTDIFTVCPQGSNTLSSAIGYNLHPTFFLLSYVDTYMNGVSCVAANMVSISYVLVYCSAASFVSRALGLPPVSTTLVICLLTFSETFLNTEILLFLAGVSAASLATAVSIMIQFWRSRRMMTDSKQNQSRQQVNESMVQFYRMADVIQICPLLIAIGLCAKETLRLPAIELFS